MKAHYTDAEIVELSMCLGSWLAFGRLNHVLGLDTACVLPSALVHARDQLAPDGLTARGRPRMTGCTMSDPGTGDARSPPPPGWQPPPPPPPSAPGASARPGTRPLPPGPPHRARRLRAGHARRRPQAGRDAAATAGPRRHLRRGVPDHPVQPEGHRRVGGPGRRGRDGDPGRSSPPCSAVLVDLSLDSSGERPATADLVGLVGVVRLARRSARLLRRLGTILVTGMIAHVTAAAAIGRRLTLGEAWAATRGKRWRLIGLAAAARRSMHAAARSLYVLLVGAWSCVASGDNVLPIVVWGVVSASRRSSRSWCGSGCASTTCRCRR